MTAIAASPDVSGWAGFLFNQLARAFRAVLVTLLLIAAIPLVSSWSGYVVRSGSMEPGMSVGDVIVAQPLVASKPIPVGRVMVFDNPDKGSSHSTLIHRVVEDLGGGTYTTAGDANRENDSTPVARDDFTSRPTLSVPFIGLPLTWWGERNLRPLIFWVVLASLALYFSARPPCDPRHRRRREAHAARRAAARAGAGLRRTSLLVVPLVVLVIAIVGAPLMHADAAFSATARNSGNTWTVSTELSTAIVLNKPSSVVRGTVPVTATLNEPSGRAFAVRIEFAPAGTTTWQTMCTDSAAPFACSWVTTGTASGAYDLRAVATSGSTTYTSVVVRDIMVDNTAPTTTMLDPGTPLKGTATLSASASDAHSGVAKVVIQYAPGGSSTFKDVCTDTVAPYACGFDTTAVADGTYTFRSVATDAAGTSTTSATVTNRIVDNSFSTVTMNDPGAYLSGSTPLSAAAASSKGVSSVRIQYAPSGTSLWIDSCTDTVSPYGCTLDTLLLPDGLYTFRAILLDGSGTSTTSGTVTSRIDNNPIRAYDVQTSNGPASTAGRLENRDTMTLTYSERVNLAGITSGWTGTALAVTVRLQDGALLGLGGNDDTITVLRNGTAVNLGSVNLKQNYVQSQATAEFAATMTTSTTTVNGVTATRIILTMGSQTIGVTPPTVVSSSVMVWTPSTAVTDLNGRPVAATPASELGTSDREF